MCFWTSDIDPCRISSSRTPFCSRKAGFYLPQQRSGWPGAAKHDHQFLAIRNQFDSLDKRTQHLRGTASRIFIAELVVEGGDLVVAIFGELGCSRGGGACGREHRGQLLFAPFQSHHLLIDPLRRTALEDEIEKVDPVRGRCVDLPSAGQSEARASIGLVYFPREFLAKFLEELRFHQVLVEPVQDRAFKRAALDIEPVVAGAACPSASCFPLDSQPCGFSAVQIVGKGLHFECQESRCPVLHSMPAAPSPSKIRG